MANNKLADLNNHLFTQLERLGDESISETELEKEIERSKAINGVAKNIIENAKTALEGLKFRVTEMPNNQNMPDQFLIKENTNK